MKHLLWLSAIALLPAVTTRAEAQTEDVFVTPLKITGETSNPTDLHGKFLDPATGKMLDLDAVRAARQAEIHQAYLLLKQARAFLVKKEIVKALPLLQKVLQLEPNHREALCYLADVYIALKRPNDALQTLRPIVYPPDTPPSGIDEELVAEMKYVLALLDVGKWEEAVSTFEMSMRLQEKNSQMPMPWSVPCYSVGSGDKAHTLANVHFSSAVFDEPGLRRQAHLILGTRQTGFLPELTVGDSQKPENLYMLRHLQQAIQSDRRCLDAHFLSGVILSELDRFAEGRQAFAKAAKLAPPEAQPEIKAALTKLNAREENKKLYEAQHQAEVSQTQAGK